MRSVVMLPVLAGMLTTTAATAEPSAKILFVCNEELLAGVGSCSSLLDAINAELEGLELVATSGGELPAETIGMGIVPDQIEQAVDIACTVWLDRSQAGLVLKAHTPDSVQTLANIELEVDEQEMIDEGDAAFRLRALLAAALYLDLPGIEEPEPVIEDPPPEMIDEEFPEPVERPPDVSEPVESWGPSIETTTKPARTDWVRIDAGYSLQGFPTEKHWYHGVGFSLGILVHPRLELFLDTAISAPNTMTLGAMSTGETVKLENAQYLVGLGLGYTFVLGDSPVSLTPRAGFHLGISSSDVQAVGRTHHTKVNTAIWGGFEMRVDLTGWIALLVGFSVENLFNYEYFEIIEGADSELVFTLSQLRLGVVTGVTMSF